MSAGYDVSEMVVVPKERYHSPDVTATFPSAAEYDAVAFFGAVWSVCDTATIPWVTDEIAYARSLISLGVPTLGICFGGQLLAAAVGGRVERAPIAEIGWLSVADGAAARAHGLVRRSVNDVARRPVAELPATTLIGGNSSR